MFGMYKWNVQTEMTMHQSVHCTCTLGVLIEWPKALNVLQDKYMVGRAGVSVWSVCKAGARQGRGVAFLPH